MRTLIYYLFNFEQLPPQTQTIVYILISVVGISGLVLMKMKGII